MAEFYIYDSSLDRIGMLQNYDTIQWVEYYDDCGEVKIVADVTEANIEMLTTGNRVYNTDCSTVAKIVEVEIDETPDEAPRLTARAWPTVKLLDDRVVAGTIAERNAERAMYAAYTRNREGLPIGVAPTQGYGASVDIDVVWMSVLDAERELANQSGLGFTVDFDPYTGGETFRVYRGVNRTNPTSADYVGYLGLDAGNITNLHIIRSEADYKNIALVAGEGDGANRYVRRVSLGNFTGETARYLYVDAGSIKWEYSESVATGETGDDGQPVYKTEKKTYTKAQYNALLDAKGREALAECSRMLDVSGEASDWNLAFGQDYGLGDRLPIKIEKYNIPASARVSGVRRIYDEHGETVEPELSNFELEVTA